MSNTTRAHLKYSVFTGDEKKIGFCFFLFLSCWQFGQLRAEPGTTQKEIYFLMHSENRVLFYFPPVGHLLPAGRARPRAARRFVSGDKPRRKRVFARVHKHGG